MLITSTLITSFIAVQSPNNIEQNNIFFINDHKKEFHIDSKYNKLKKEIEQYASFEENWNGYGAKSIGLQAINSAKSFLALLENDNIKIPTIFPRTYGAIGFYWQLKDDYIEATIHENGKVSFFSDVKNSVYGEDNLSIDAIPEKLVHEISMLYNLASSKKSYLVTSRADSQPQWIA